ncbi:MAG TPA: class I SAM-dependent methyltransferase [Gemmatimonadaceae bacterium]
MTCSLDDPRVRAVLGRLHAEAQGQRLQVMRHVAASITDRLFGRHPSLSVEVERLGRFHAAVSRRQGRFLYLVARSVRATRIVEFGTSVGISAAYLACAVRDNGGGEVIGSEMNPVKLAGARRNLADAGLGGLVDVREGDARETLRHVGGQVDMLFLDGFPELYLPLLRMLMPTLRAGAVVLADNILTHRRILAPYRRFVRDRPNGFCSETLLMKFGTEYSVRL